MNKIRDDVLRATIAQLRAENRKLRRIAKGSGQAVKLENIHRFAQHLLAMRFAGQAITQRAVIDAGFSRRWWQWGRALLMAARVHDGKDVVADDFDMALAALNEAAELVHLSGMNALLTHMPAHCRLENYYKRLSKNVSNTMSKNVSNTVSKRAFNSDSHSASRGAGGGALRSGGGRDRRAEIEQRLNVMEVQR